MSLKDCIVEHHEAHERPRLYALREAGQLWLFDICNPHVWPGSHWGVPDYRSGGVVQQQQTGDERSIQATGFGLTALRSAFCARLLFALSSVDGVFRGSVDITNDLRRAIDWVPDLPASTPIVATRYGIRCFPSTHLALRCLLDISIEGWGDIDVDMADGTRLVFLMEAETWYVTGDAPRMPIVIAKLAAEFGIELKRNPEPLRDHRPNLAEWWYSSFDHDDDVPPA